LPQLVDICGYEFPTNLQNCTQKDVTKVIIPKSIFGGATFSWNTPYSTCIYNACKFSNGTESEGLKVASGMGTQKFGQP